MILIEKGARRRLHKETMRLIYAALYIDDASSLLAARFESDAFLIGRQGVPNLDAFAAISTAATTNAILVVLLVLLLLLGGKLIDDWFLKEENQVGKSLDM